jgi:hypothetical protein
MAAQAEKVPGRTITVLIPPILKIFKLVRRAAMAQSASSGPEPLANSPQQTQETSNDHVY